MPYRLILIIDNIEHISPFIAPDNTCHNFDDLSIPDKVHKLGATLVNKFEDVQAYKCIKE